MPLEITGFLAEWAANSSPAATFGEQNFPKRSQYRMSAQAYPAWPRGKFSGGNSAVEVSRGIARVNTGGKRVRAECRQGHTLASWQQLHLKWVIIIIANLTSRSYQQGRRIRFNTIRCTSDGQYWHTCSSDCTDVLTQTV